jgi:hypothetical protein
MHPIAPGYVKNASSCGGRRRRLDVDGPDIGTLGDQRQLETWRRGTD